MPKELRHSESGKFNEVPTRTVKTIPSGGSGGTGVKGVTYSQANEMGATVKMDFTGDSTKPHSPVINDLGVDRSPGANVGVKGDLRDGNSNPSASVRNLPPNSNLRGRNNKDWGLVR